MFTEQPLSPKPFGKITQQTHDEHQKLYAGYVKNANTVIEKLATYDNDATKVYETGELYRRFAFEYNGMRNHEIYFALLQGNGDASVRESAPTLGNTIADQWGTFENWRNAFDALALTRGIGWAMLSYDKQTGSLIMHWVDEQQLGQLQGTVTIIALDMWEHSYVADYQPSGKKQYVEDFFKNINWTVAEKYFSDAQNK